MKKEYDFSKAERGRFYRRGAVFNLPVYLDKENRAFVEKVAQSRHSDVSAVVNDLIRSQKKTISSASP
jgi:hypothetical protein